MESKEYLKRSDTDDDARIDWGIIFCVLVLAVIGMTALYVALSHDNIANPTKVLFSQAIWYFIGIGAVGGAVTMLIDPSGGLMGMDAMLPYFKKLPFADVLFTDFVFSGIALLIVNGITNLVAAVLLFAKKKSGAVCSMIFGITLML